MASYQIRPLTEAELPAFLLVDQHAFNDAPRPAGAHANFLSPIELDRTLAAVDDGAPVGGTGVYRFPMRGPGAMAAVAGGGLVAGVPPPPRRRIPSPPVRPQPARAHT